MQKKEIVDLIKGHLASVLGIEPDEVDENVSFFKLGISSVQALKVVNRVRKALNVEVNPVAIFEYKCVEDLANYLVQFANQ